MRWLYNHRSFIEIILGLNLTAFKCVTIDLFLRFNPMVNKGRMSIKLGMCQIMGGVRVWKELHWSKVSPSVLHETGPYTRFTCGRRFSIKSMDRNPYQVLFRSFSGPEPRAKLKMGPYKKTLPFFFSVNLGPFRCLGYFWGPPFHSLPISRCPHANIVTCCIKYLHQLGLGPTMLYIKLPKICLSNHQWSDNTWSALCTVYYGYVRSFLFIYFLYI